MITSVLCQRKSSCTTLGSACEETTCQGLYCLVQRLASPASQAGLHLSMRSIFTPPSLCDADFSASVLGAFPMTGASLIGCVAGCLYPASAPIATRQIPVVKMQTVSKHCNHHFSNYTCLTGTDKTATTHRTPLGKKQKVLSGIASSAGTGPQYRQRCRPRSGCKEGGGGGV